MNHPVLRKSIRASAALSEVLSYPPKEVLSSGELDALDSLKMPPAALTALERIVANACASTLFQFFCLMNSVADPELTKMENWSGAEFVSPREEGEFLHDEFSDKYLAYEKARTV